MTAIRDRGRTISPQEHKDLRAKEKWLEEIISHPSTKKRTHKGIEEAVLKFLLYSMEHSRGIYAEYGASAFWSLCEGLGYILGQEVWEPLWELAYTYSIAVFNDRYPKAHGIVPTFTTEQFQDLKQASRMVIQERKAKQQAQAGASAKQ